MRFTFLGLVVRSSFSTIFAGASTRKSGRYHGISSAKLFPKERPKTTTDQHQIMKTVIPEAKQKITYRFAVFKVVLDFLPTSQIKKLADDYKECIVWDLLAGIVSLDREIQ